MNKLHIDYDRSGSDETFTAALGFGIDSAVGSTYNFMPQVFGNVMCMYCVVLFLTYNFMSQVFVMNSIIIIGACHIFIKSTKFS